MNTTALAKAKKKLRTRDVNLEVRKLVDYLKEGLAKRPEYRV